MPNISIISSKRMGSLPKNRLAVAQTIVFHRFPFKTFINLGSKFSN